MPANVKKTNEKQALSSLNGSVFVNKKHRHTSLTGNCHLSAINPIEKSLQVLKSAQIPYPFVKDL
jgi:hypothetical protein